MPATLSVKTGGGWVLNLIGHNTDKRGKVKMDVTPKMLKF